MSRDRGLHEFWPGLLALGVFAVSLWAQPSALVGVFYDDGIYVVLAKALAEGEGYRYLHLPGAPPGVHFPILYPAVLSFLWRMWPAFPQNVALFQLFDSAALAVAAGLIAKHARRWNIPPVVQYVSLPLAFVAFPLLTIVGVRFSEPLFLALLAGALVLADRKEVSGARGAAAGVLAGLAALTRSIGIAAVASIPLVLWLGGKRKPAVAALIGSVALLGPWVIWLFLHGDAVDPRIASNYGTYLAAAGQTGLLGILAGLDFRVFAPLARLTLPAVPPVIWLALAGLLAAAVVWGAVVVAPRVPVFVTTLGLYLAIVTVWPFAPDRFVWIVLPWLAMLAVVGSMAAWRKGSWTRWPVVLLALAVLVGYPRREAVSLWHRQFAATAEGITAPFSVLVPAIIAELEPSAVVASEDEALVYLYTGRHSVPSYLFRWSGRSTTPLSRDSTVQFYCDAGVTHLALSGPAAPAAPLVDELAQGSDSTLSLLFRVANGPALYEFRCPD
ncbi:MAG: hypothetical protein IIB35_09440 [Gemmatimonadetes bacterium]|nr:hypothetical protein [Gemmatimonadota bacterium]